MSLIGKALAVRNAAPPVPIGGGRYQVSRLLPGPSDDEAYMRAYGSQGTVFSNVSLLASSTAKPEWRLYRKAKRDARVRYTTSDEGSDQRQEVVQHQALTVLNRPATITVGGRELVIWTRFGLFELSQTWMELTGKSYWIVETDQRSTIPMGLWPVRPDRMQPVQDRKKFLTGWIYSSPDGNEQIPFGPDEVIFSRYPDPLDAFGGAGPVQSVLTEIDAFRAAGEWQRNFFHNSAEPGGVVQVDHELSDPEFDELVARWRETHRGVSRAHRVAVLEGGQTWTQNAHSQRDMEFVNGRTASRDIIREALGMHKVMTGVTDDVNRANAQTGEEVFGSWKIIPRLDRWKDVLNFQYLPLFGSTGEGVEFDYKFPMPLNREQDNAELTAKATAVLTLIQAGYDPADVLEVVGLPPMGTAAKPAAAPLPDAGDGDTGTGGVSVPASADVQEMEARLRKMLSNGHMPVATGGR